RQSKRFARLLASSHVRAPAERVVVGAGGLALTESGSGGVSADPMPPPRTAIAVAPKADPPPLPAPPRARTLREIFRLARTDARFGPGAGGVFLFMVVLGLAGWVPAWLWADLVAGSGGLFWPTAGIVAALLVTAPMPYLVGRWFPEWWVRQMLRI